MPSAADSPAPPPRRRGHVSIPERAGARAVTDAAGVRWQVREVDSTATPGGKGPRCLLCESRHAVLRLWHFPAGWQALPDGELLGLWGLA